MEIIDDQAMGYGPRQSRVIVANLKLIIVLQQYISSVLFLLYRGNLSTMMILIPVLTYISYKQPHFLVTVIKQRCSLARNHRMQRPPSVSYCVGKLSTFPLIIILC